MSFLTNIMVICDEMTRWLVKSKSMQINLLGAKRRITYVRPVNNDEFRRILSRSKIFRNYMFERPEDMLHMYRFTYFWLYWVTHTHTHTHTHIYIYIYIYMNAIWLRRQVAIIICHVRLYPAYLSINTSRIFMGLRSCSQSLKGFVW